MNPRTCKAFADAPSCTTWLERSTDATSELNGWVKWQTTMWWPQITKVASTGPKIKINIAACPAIHNSHSSICPSKWNLHSLCPLSTICSLLANCVSPFPESWIPRRPPYLADKTYPYSYFNEPQSKICHCWNTMNQTVVNLLLMMMMMLLCRVPFTMPII